MSEDVKKRFEAAHWHVQKIDGHDRDAVRKAIRKAQKVTDKPSMIMAKTVIGRGSPKFHGTSRAHGEPLGAEEATATKVALGWPAEPTFYVPDEVRAEFARKMKKLARARKQWEKGMAEWRARNPQLAAEWDAYWSHSLPDGYELQLVGVGQDRQADRDARVVESGHPEDRRDRAVRHRRRGRSRVVDENEFQERRLDRTAER